jgi:hypothetical protein
MSGRRLLVWPVRFTTTIIESAKSSSIAKMPCKWTACSRTADALGDSEQLGRSVLEPSGVRCRANFAVPTNDEVDLGVSPCLEKLFCLLPMIMRYVPHYQAKPSKTMH